MPRRRRGQPPTLPLAGVKLPVGAVFNPRISDPAFRLLAVVTACSHETGWCDLNNTQLADVLGVSRQFVSRLIRELGDAGLLDDETLPGGDHRLTPATPSGDTAAVILVDTGRARKAAPREAVVQTQNIASQPLAPLPSSEGEYQGGQVEGLDQPFARLAALWVRYFGDITPVEADYLGDFLDDPALARLAEQGQETAETWITAAIEETALAKAKNPIKYFLAILNNWIKCGTRKPQKGTNNATSTPDHAASTGPGRTGPGDRNTAVAAILDRLESGQLEPDGARQQLAVYGHVL